jgi:hypothetical protein
MAELSSGARADIWAELMRRYSVDKLSCGVTKAELRAAVDAIDTWLNSNAAAANTAIPQPARGALSTTQKALLLMYVIQRRYLDGA